jgi:hypothetical protein
LSKWFTVSHPAQTVFKVLGGAKPNGFNSLAKEALRKAKEKRGKKFNRGSNRTEG